MRSQDEKLENILADPWLARPTPRWSFSILFVLIALFVLKPLIVNHLVSRAEVYASYGLYNNAARECKKAILFDRTNEHAWNTLGSSYGNQEDLDNAVNAYLHAINANPSNKIAHFKIATVFAIEENYTRAASHFEHIRSLGPESPETLAENPFSYYRASLKMLSLCYEKTGKYNKQKSVLAELARAGSSPASAAR